MFGYVKPFKPELKIKDYETYKAIYCSLCKAMGKNYGIVARNFLSYDITFYIMLMRSIENDSCDSFIKGHCKFNPLKKCNYVKNIDKVFDEASALTIIMAFYKVKDDINDNNIFKRILKYLIYPYIKQKHKKASKLYPHYDEIVSKYMSIQSDVENGEFSSLDKSAHSTAKALSELFAYNISDNTNKRIVERLGYCLGRWVYLIDAYDDLKSDLKEKSFNPFIEKYEIKTAEQSKDIDEDILKTIRLTANETALALNLLDLHCYKDIIENIVFEGLEKEVVVINKKRGEACE
ncbi:MAG: DUF5685 family protein [Oscillospiraceae bacterium]